jgi:hypothetical protein
MYRRMAGYCAAVLVLMFLMSHGTFVAHAEPSPTSPNYRFDETSITGGGLIEANSANFRSSSSLGDTAVGNSASTNYQVEGGSQTTDDPALTFIVEDGDASFNDFSATTTATATASFSIINYTSYGYVVHILGTPPSNGPHTIPALATSSSSLPGTEQFGINLVANTSPISFGANPDHGQFGFGSATDDYDDPNMFRFVSGEAIASAPKSSGRTVYTISYIVNVGALTPGGQYKGNQTIIVTGTY